MLPVDGSSLTCRRTLLQGERVMEALTVCAIIGNGIMGIALVYMLADVARMHREALDGIKPCRKCGAPATWYSVDTATDYCDRC